jgi:hypothetical protein
MGATGSAVGLGLKAADELFGADKITPKAEPAVDVSTTKVSQEPMMQQPTQEQPQEKNIDEDIYNHPDDRTIMSSWKDKILDIFSNEMSGVTQTW